MDVLLSQSEPDEDPYKVYRERYQDVMRRTAAAIRRAGQIRGRK